MKSKGFISVFVLFVAAAATAFSQGNALENIKWIHGPSVGSLKSTASIKVPEGYTFASAKDTIALMEAMQNPPSGNEMGFVSPAGQEWFVVFEFNETGYIKDDEKSSLDADAMLKSIRSGTERSNEERRSRGWSTINVVGWYQAPKYNDRTNNLEWATRLESDGKPLLNYNTRLLGRRGVMRVTLVADPSKMTEIMPDFNRLMAGFSYSEGEKYAEFKSGDKVAEYGLAALVVGGASAVAVKSGLFKSLWKILVAVALGAAAFVRKIFGKKSE